MIDSPEPPSTLSVIEERADVSKVKVTTGRIRVRTVNDSHEEAVRASLESEAFEVSRVPIDRQVEVAPEIRTEGDLTIIPVLEEVLVIEKRLVLKEEIHLRRRTKTETVESIVTLRRQRAEVEQVDEADRPKMPDQREP